MRTAVTALVVAAVTITTSVAACPSPPGPRHPARIADLPWHYVVAHRGAGAYLAPENTEQALRRGNADPDVDMLEFDVRVLRDGAGAVWHDATVDRISTSTGPVSSLDSAAYTRLVIDASRWFGGGVADTHPILLDHVLDEFGGRRLLLAHPKGTAATRLVVEEVRRRGLADAVLVQTFSRSDLKLVIAARLNGQLLIGSTTQAAVDTPAAVRADGITRVSLDSGLPDATIRAYVAAGLTVAAWNVDRQYRRDRLHALGVRGIDSNDPVYARGDVARYRRTSDPFATQTWWYGQLGQRQSPERLGASARGRFIAPDRWHIDRGEYPLFVLQGWASPADPTAYTLSLRMRYDSLGADRTRWGGVYFAARNDAAFNDKDAPLNGGYTAILRTDGTLAVYRKDPTRTVLLGSIATPALSRGTIVKMRISVRGSTLTVTRYGVPDNTIRVDDATYRGGHLFLGRSASRGHQGPGLSFENVTIG